MLPGLRFLFAAIVLSISILVFGLGAAALLRAAHEEFASIPSRRAPPETMFAQHGDARPALAMLRVDASPASDENILSSQTPDDMQVASEQLAFVPAAAEWEKSATEPEKIGARPDVATPAEDPPSSEAPLPAASTPGLAAEAETPVQIETPSLAAETKVAAIAEVAPAASEPTAIAPDQAAAPADEGTRIAETRIATLGGPPVTIETRTSSMSAPAVVRKSASKKRVATRRKTSPRPRIAPPVPHQPASPFATPFGSTDNHGFGPRRAGKA
jgi:hypothetical protein